MTLCAMIALPYGIPFYYVAIESETRVTVIDQSCVNMWLLLRRGG